MFPHVFFEINSFCARVAALVATVELLLNMQSFLQIVRHFERRLDTSLFLERMGSKVEVKKNSCKYRSLMSDESESEK